MLISHFAKGFLPFRRAAIFINPDVTLSNTSHVAFGIRWTNNITLTDIQAKFNMSDGSSKTVDLWNGNLPIPPLNSCLFTVNSTGEAGGLYRTISATYDLMPTTYATTSRIADIDEIDTKITSP